MTEQDAIKLAQIRMGDRVEYRDHGAVASGEVCGWTSEHGASTTWPMMLVYGGWHGPDKRVPLHAVLSRERPGLPGKVSF